MATAPEGSTTEQAEPVNVVEEELTEEEIAAKRQADLDEAMAAREEAEATAQEERDALAEAATSHVGQPEETPANALEPEQAHTEPPSDDEPKPKKNKAKTEE